MKETVLKEFNDSLERCLRRENFLATFYERFVAVSDEIAALFLQQDMDRQRRLLKASLFMCMSAAYGDDAACHYLHRLGYNHRLQGGSLDQYDIWLNILVKVASEFDPLFKLETAIAWEHVMRPGVELVKQGYREAHQVLG